MLELVRYPVSDDEFVIPPLVHRAYLESLIDVHGCFAFSRLSPDTKPWKVDCEDISMVPMQRSDTFAYLCSLKVQDLHFREDIVEWVHCYTAVASAKRTWCDSCPTRVHHHLMCPFLADRTNDSDVNDRVNVNSTSHYSTLCSFDCTEYITIIESDLEVFFDIPFNNDVTYLNIPVHSDKCNGISNC